MVILLVFSSPELAQGELLGYLNVRRPSCVVRRSSSVNNFLVNTLVATVLTQSFSKMPSMFVLMISGSSSNMGGMGSKSRSLGQIFVKSC